MLVRVGSKNPVKVRATREAFRGYFPRVRVVGVEGPRGTEWMPRSLREIARSARDRARRVWGGEGYAVGIEAGTFRLGGRRYLITVACVTDGRRLGWGSGPFFEAIGTRNKIRGMIAEVTGGRVTRADSTRLAVLMALARFLHRGF